jgi:hypothetical protein
MYENREISCTPWSHDQGRSAKAINRTADMNVQEKSDCAAVPVNQPNKEGQPSAEAGEGRARTEENIIQSRMHPTQSGKRMSQGLDGVRQAARARKQERFTALLHHLNVGLLRENFYALKRQASPGVDGVTWQEYETGLEDRPDVYLRIVPPALPAPSLLVVLSGIAEILGGFGLLVPFARRMAAWGLVLLIFAVFPANIYIAVSHLPFPGILGQSGRSGFVCRSNSP